ncbi:MAG: relaxase domain-containing protein [Cellulomonadaceae bacterium]|nr:relaxase domain-containing protein [Cellulomonadaceae bacterium]
MSALGIEPAHRIRPGDRVAEEAMAAVFRDGRDPLTGETLGRGLQGNGALVGFDLTFTALKPVSVLRFLRDEPTRATGYAVHRAALDTAITASLRGPFTPEVCPSRTVSKGTFGAAQPNLASGRKVCAVQRLRHVEPIALAGADRIPAACVHATRLHSRELPEDLGQLGEPVYGLRAVASRCVRAAQEVRGVLVDHDDSAVRKREADCVDVAHHVVCPATRRVAEHLQLHLSGDAKRRHTLGELHSPLASTLPFSAARQVGKGQPVLHQHSRQIVDVLMGQLAGQ